MDVCLRCLAIRDTFDVADTSLIFICHDWRWRVCRWSVPLYALWELVCRGDEGEGRKGPDETPSGQTSHPANSHPSGSGRSALIRSHQRVPAHWRTLSGLPALLVPCLITDKKRQKPGSSSISQPHRSALCRQSGGELVALSQSYLSSAEHWTPQADVQQNFSFPHHWPLSCVNKQFVFHRDWVSNQNCTDLSLSIQRGFSSIPSNALRNQCNIP